MSPAKRKRERHKLSLAVEIHSEGSRVPLRGVTADISLDGCYIENPLPLPVGIGLKLKLVGSDAAPIPAKVVSSHPQGGSGIRFTRIPPQDRDALARYLKLHLAQQSALCAKT